MYVGWMGMGTPHTNAPMSRWRCSTGAQGSPPQHRAAFADPPTALRYRGMAWHIDVQCGKGFKQHPARRGTGSSCGRLHIFQYHLPHPHLLRTHTSARACRASPNGAPKARLCPACALPHSRQSIKQQTRSSNTTLHCAHGRPKRCRAVGQPVTFPMDLYRVWQDLAHCESCAWPRKLPSKSKPLEKKCWRCLGYHAPLARTAEKALTMTGMTPLVLLISPSVYAHPERTQGAALPQCNLHAG